MIENLFFDTDCLSSFLWVGREDIILKQYKGRIVIPQFVYEEFCRPAVGFLKLKLDHMLLAKLIMKKEIISGTDEAKLFLEMTKRPKNGRPIIGKGEASALVLAKSAKGIIASNNLRDVKLYTELFDLKLLTTADILVKALANCILTRTTPIRFGKICLIKNANCLV